MNSAVKTCVAVSLAAILLQPTLAAEMSVQPEADAADLSLTSKPEVNGLVSPSSPTSKLRVAQIVAPSPMINLTPKNSSQTSTPPDSSTQPVLEQLLRKEQAEPNIINGLNLPHPPSNSPQELAEDAELPLSIPALDIADAINITADLRRLHQLKHHYLVLSKSEDHIELMELRMNLLETVFSVFLDSRDTIASMDTEIAKFDARADIMENNRDKMIRNNTVLNFASSGILQAFASAIQVGTPNSLQNTGNEVEVMQAAFQTLLSTFALRAGKGGKQSAAPDPNMLAPILGRTPVDYSKYPPAVWSFLNMSPNNKGATRREILINHWVQINRIPAQNKRGTAQQLDEICGTVELKKEVTIDLLRNRIPMLEDSRAVVATMVQAMREIMTFIRRP